jgi:sulfate transport system permease protein
MRDKIAKFMLIGIACAFALLMLGLPLAAVATYALREGFGVFIAAITDPYALSALRLTLLTTVISVSVNTVFGLFAAWALTRFSFRGRSFLTTVMDIPFAVSPVIAGLVFILVFGRIGWAAPLMSLLNVKIVFALPGIVLATIFVTFPFVSRELIPVLNARGVAEEEAAALMGASGWKIFFRITLPHIKWALMYGVILCSARALGEFGAVSVVSGHLRGKTNTLPLHVEVLFGEFHLTAAFAVSSVLMLLAVLSLILKTIVEMKGKKEGSSV